MVTSKYFLLSFFVFFLFTHSFLFGQPNPNNESSKISFTVFANSENYSDLENELINKLKSSLELNGLFSIEDFQYELLLGIKEIDGMNKVAISVTELQPLAKETIELGKDAQIFYSKEKKENKSIQGEDSKFIREYVSEEYLKQFRMVWNNRIEIIERSELDNFIQKLVSKFL